MSTALVVAPSVVASQGCGKPEQPGGGPESLPAPASSGVDTTNVDTTEVSDDTEPGTAATATAAPTASSVPGSASEVEEGNWDAGVRG